jgi:hypothetical protein
MGPFPGERGVRIWVDHAKNSGTALIVIAGKETIGDGAARDFPP